MGAHLVQGFFQQQGIGAEIDVLAPLQYPIDKVEDMRVKERFAAGDGDNRGRAFINRVQAFFQGHHLLDGVGVLADAAAAGAGQIAEMGWFKHQHQRVFVNLIHFVGNDVFGEIVIETQGKTH